MKAGSSNKRLTWDKKRKMFGFFALLPLMILCFVFILLPLARVIYISFFDWNGVSSDMDFVGFANYAFLPETEGFWEMAKATLIYAMGVTILVVVSSYILALALDARGRGRLNRSLMRALWFVPSLLSGAIVGIIWRITYNYNSGLINYLLGLVNIPKVNWLETQGVTMLAIIVSSAWVQIGMCFVVFMAGLQSIPNELLEAATLDGASKGQIRRTIILPLMMPSITINSITTTIAAFKAYELPFTISKGLPGYSTRLLTQRVYFYSFNTNKYGIAAAMAVLLIIVITLISVAQFKWMKKKGDSLQ